MKDKLKDEYENIKIPDDYHQKVQKSIVYVRLTSVSLI